MNKRIVYTAITLSLFFALSWIGFTIFEIWNYQYRLAPIIQKELEFKHGSPYINVEGSMIEVFTIHPKKNGAISKSGIKDGDIVISESITSFYKLLSESNGKKVTVIVVDGGDGPPLDKRKQRVANIKTPLE